MNIKSSSDPKILYIQVAETKQKLNDLKKLLFQREKIDAEIENTQLNIEKNCKKNRCFNLREVHENQFLQDLVERRKHLDKQIDELEELSLDCSIALEQELLEAIFFHYPEERKAHIKQATHLEKLEKLKNQILEIKQTREGLSECLSKAIQISKKIWKGGFLSYLFGISPVLQIEKQNKLGSQLVKKMIHLLENTHELFLDNRAVQLLCNKLLVVSKQLENQYQKSWNFQIINQFFGNLKKELDFYQQEIEKLYAEIEQERKSQNEYLEKWMRNISMQ